MVPIVMCLIPTVVGSAMLVGLNNSGEKGALLFGMLTSSVCRLYADGSIQLLTATYLISTAGYSLSGVYAYNASNTAGYTKKLTINAMTLATFSLGNIIGTEIFLPKDAPGYIPGKIAIMVLMTAQLFVSLLLRWINTRLNRKKREALQQEKERLGLTDEEVEKERQRHAFMDMTDKQ
jgi:hypothetical protein